MFSLPALCCLVALCIIGQHDVTAQEQQWSPARGPFGPMMSTQEQERWLVEHGDNLRIIEANLRNGMTPQQVIQGFNETQPNGDSQGIRRTKRHTTCAGGTSNWMFRTSTNPWMVGMSPNPFPFQDPTQVLFSGIGITAEDLTEIKLVLPYFGHDAAIVNFLCFRSRWMHAITIVLRDCHCDFIIGASYLLENPTISTWHCRPLGLPVNEVKSIEFLLHQWGPPPIEVGSMFAIYCDDSCCHD